MTNKDRCSAPKIRIEGLPLAQRKSDWKMIYPKEFFEALGKDKRLTANARLYLLVVASQADGYPVAEQTIKNMTGMGGTTFDRTRKLLEEIGYITIIDRKETVVHLDKIMSVQNEPT